MSMSISCNYWCVQITTHNSVGGEFDNVSLVLTPYSRHANSVLRPHHPEIRTAIVPISSRLIRARPRKFSSSPASGSCMKKIPVCQRSTLLF